jgi:heme-degrading monooxygenase HmoA
MTEFYAAGQWFVAAGHEEEFIRRWHDYVSWGQRAHADGFEGARLLRDEQDPTHFHSYLAWSRASARDRWRDDPEMPQRLAACEEVCLDVHTGAYREASRVG